MKASRLLLVDDHEMVVRVLRDFLLTKFPSATIDTCTSGEQALQRMKVLTYDVVLADIVMPGIDGFELLERARADQPKTPVLLMTGTIDRTFILRALRGGAFDYLEKPIDNETLVHALQRALEKRSSEIDERRRLNELAEQAAAMSRTVEQRTRELEEASRIKDEFIANLSHELRTPLTSIVGWARLLRHDELSPEDRVHAVEAIDRNAIHQARLVEDLLDISRIAAGKLQIKKRPVGLDTVVRSAIEGIAPTVLAKGISISEDLAPCHVHGDPDRLRQVVTNLLANAIKFTDKGGKIRVTLRRASPVAMLEVTDTGIGIAPAFTSHVFDRFRQADSGASRTGLGVGLSIVKHLVMLHDGHVSVHSAGPGQGSTFSVRLPLFDTERVAPDGDERTERVQITGLKVLVAEDDPDARHVVRTALQHRGASVIEASTIAAAIAAMAEQPDVVLCDITMPDSDGYAFIEVVRTLPRGTRVAAAALTAHARPSDVKRALAAGFDMHLAKPIEPEHLARAVVELHQRARARV